MRDGQPKLDTRIPGLKFLLRSKSGKDKKLSSLSMENLAFNIQPLPRVLNAECQEIPGSNLVPILRFLLKQLINLADARLGGIERSRVVDYMIGFLDFLRVGQLRGHASQHLLPRLLHVDL